MKSKNLRLIIILVFVILFCLLCAVAPYLAPNDPNYANLQIAKESPSQEFPLGTDWLGRCILSRILDGAPASIYSALAVVGFTLIVGSCAGIVGGYFGGVIDSLLMRIVDVFLAFPGMVLAIAVAGILGPGMNNAIIALVATGWTQYARLSRSIVMSIRRENYINAAKLNGQSTYDILVRHILPNALRPLVITASLSIGGTIIGLAGLSFLGLGAQPPLAEWGSMLSDGRGFLQQSPWVVVYPGLAILFASMIFNILGDSVRDALDPREKHSFITF